jgi:hypothetical protein
MATARLFKWRHQITEKTRAAAGPGQRVAALIAAREGNAALRRYWMDKQLKCRSNLCFIKCGKCDEQLAGDYE